jgi:hypothetical protein
MKNTIRCGWLAGMALLLSTGLLAQGSQLWSHPSTGEGWTPSTVALGNGGSEVISQFGPFFDRTRVFSGYDINPPTPLLETNQGSASFHHQVDSAETRDLSVTIHDTYADQTLSTRRVHIQRLSVSQPSTNWTFQHPTLTNGTDRINVRVSRDGSRIVAGVYNFQTNRTDVVVLGPDSPTPVASFSVDTQAGYKAFELSADGTHLLVASGTMLKVHAIPAGTQIWSDFLWEPSFNAFGISGDGSHFAWGATNKVKLYKKNSGGTYSLHAEPAVGAAGNWACDRLEFSDDSSTLVTAYNLTDTFRSMRVQAIDLATLTLPMSRTISGSGSLQICVADLSVSRNGSRFALANWGDSAGSVPEVQIFARNSTAAVAGFDLPGSALALDLSADGRRVAVASKAVHANQSGSGGRIDLYATETEDAQLVGSPRAGTSVTARIRGTPGAVGWMLVSPTLRPTPLVFPGLGTLYLSSTGLVRIPLGIVNGSGLASGSWSVPALPGSTRYLQAFHTQPRKLGEDCLTVTILP